MTSKIKLDYDKITSRDVCLIFEHRAWLLKHFGVLNVRAFSTKKGYHVRIEIEEDLEYHDIILLQMLMGSDIHREIYDFIRAHAGQLVDKWNKLYTKKYLVLGTKIKEPLGGERQLKGLTKDLIKSIEDAKDLEGFI